MSTHVIVLAAGEGKRMRSPMAKVAHLAAGLPLVSWVVRAVQATAPERTVVVVGHRADQVTSHLPDGMATAVQADQLGTGHATRVGLEALGEVAEDDTIVVLYGDMPLLGPGLIARLSARPPEAAALMVTARFPDPAGYGRVIRGRDGSVEAVVEERDCTPEQREIDEVNAGVYAFRARDLVDALGRIGNQNAQGEYYLTDVVSILVGRGERVEALEASPEEVMGINSHEQLADAAALLRARKNRELMEAGVWMLDPARVYVDDTVTVAAGARLYPGVHLEGSTTVGPDAQVGPDVFAVDSQIGARSRVWYAVVREAVIGEDCDVGPFASLRKGTVLSRSAKVGTFVETKNTSLGEGAKAPHLSYLGDATVGARTNIGAGTITCNFDGHSKHPTEIGEEAFIGSDTMLVAPLKIGDGAVTGAGSVITSDVEAGALAVERSEQRNIPGYAQKRAARKAAEEAKAKD